ncbi:hypothetical protein [Octadecabacter sp. SW4]|uniref:hypothetical protein n=1 Tax=Octadecabacter sp. SW4 TaxID=2602067 RepID=UPI00155A4077|nr:hypothetical protein [Octadecabacter sp. SW4]
MVDPVFATRVMGLHWAARGAGFAVLGAVMALGQAPYDLPVVFVIGLGLVFALFMSTRSARGRLGWAGPWALAILPMRCAGSSNPLWLMPHAMAGWPLLRCS